MIKKIVVGVCGLVFASIFAFPAFADQSTGYRQYFNEGVKAFQEHDDQKALRCFRIAQIYDPNGQDLNKYLHILEQRGVAIEVYFSKPPERSIGYIYYFSGGYKAFIKHDYKKSVRYFKIAKIFNPASSEADLYLEILSQGQGVPQKERQAQVVSVNPVPAYSPPVQAQPAAVMPQAQPNLPSVQPQPAAAAPQPAISMPVPQPIVRPRSYSSSVQPQPSAVMPRPTLYVTAEGPKQAPVVIELSQLINSTNAKPTLLIELNSAVILEGKNIQKFLTVDEGFIGVKTIDTDHIRIDALRIGTTFLHIWDDQGRHTLYVEVIFPKTLTFNELQATNGVQHAQPFTATYTNDWTTYYSGKNISELKRQSYDFNETLSVAGETPYGFFDTSGSYTDFNSFSQFDTYTIGLSQIPIEGTSNFNLRGFDDLRYMSPLTMPGTRLRGAFADVDLMDDLIGISVSHGQEQAPLGFISMGESQFNNSYIDAAKITLFPKSNTDQYSFNFATAYGSDRPSYLTNHVYSVQGQHAFNDFLTLKAEQATDSSHDSSLASLRWQDGAFNTGLNFRNVDKDYSTISTLPANQGETGAAWTTDMDFKNISENTFIEAYQDHLYSNPDDPRAFNYDGNGHLRANFNPDLWSDTDLNFVDTPGEQSPQRSLGLNQRLSRSFGIWNSMKGTVFGGAGYQNSHNADSDISNFDREDVIAGIQLPLTQHVTSYANYEYDWLDQLHNGGNSNPSVVNAGLEYQKQFNPRFSFNTQLDYRDELGVQASNNSFLSGEESVIVTSGFSYNPTPDVSIFADGNASRVLSHIGDPSYDDFEVHVGMRITFGGATYWDPLGTVSGIVFKDRSGNGKFGPGDEGIADVKVKVGDKEAVTDKNGRYSIQVRAKGVTVYPIMDTVPGGLLFSTPPSLNIQIFQGRRVRADFGFISQTGIYGIVFVDKNGTGVPNDGDKFIGKVKVVLDGKTIQKSDSHGAFYFRNVVPGKHTISIDLNTLAINMVPLVKLINKIDVAEGTNYMFNIPVQVKQAEGGE